MKFLALLLAAASCFAADQKIVGGPFVMNATSRAATIVWIVESGEVSLQAAGSPTKIAPVFRTEKTTFTGLAPNTHYDYEVAGMKGSFKTAPAREESFNFVMYGDTRTRHDVHRRVVSALLKQGTPDFIIHTGDLVENGDDNSLWSIFFDAERDLLRQTTFFPTLGNHERNAHDYFELFPGVKPYYSFDWGSAHFSVIDSDIGTSGSTRSEKDAFSTEQRIWLEDDLASHQNSQFRFVVAHHPPYSAVASRQAGNPQTTTLLPLFEKYHVSAGLFGHDHNYQHYLLKNGIHLVTCGGGGAPLYDVDMPPKDILQKAISIENFVKVSVEGKTAKFQAIDINGQTLDEFTIQGSAAPKQ